VDVLQVIKDDQQKVKDLFASCATATVKTIQASLSGVERALFQQLHVEQNYLYPELDGFLKRGDVHLDIWAANHRSIERLWKKLTSDLKKNELNEKDLADRWQSVSVAVESHFDSQNEVILPAMRKCIPTSDREELAEVFTDAKEDMVSFKAPAKGHAKRA